MIELLPRGLRRAIRFKLDHNLASRGLTGGNGSDSGAGVGDAYGKVPATTARGQAGPKVDLNGEDIQPRGTIRWRRHVALVAQVTTSIDGLKDRRPGNMNSRAF